MSLDLLHLEFAWPLAVLLLPLPWLIQKRTSTTQDHQSAPYVPMYAAIQSLGLGLSDTHQQHSKWKQLMVLLAWVFLVLASMRPQYVGDPIELPLSGRDLMLAIDISPSMEEQDLPLNDERATRLQVVKHVVDQFIQQREGDRVGLILFGSEPYLQSPLTFDTVTVNTLLQESFLGMAGNATAIGDAIALGVKRLRDREEQSRVMILLSDGSNTGGEIPPIKAAQLAQQEKIKVYTIGVGADEMLVRSFFGSRKVNPSSELDEETLAEIANLTGGQYYRARSQADLDQIYQVISELEPIEQESRTYRPTKSLFYWALGTAVFFWLLSLISTPVMHWLESARAARMQHD